MLHSQNTLVALSRFALPLYPPTTCSHDVRVLAHDRILVVWIPRIRVGALATQILHRKTVLICSIAVLHVAFRIESPASTIRPGATFGDSADLAEEVGKERFEGGQTGCHDAGVHFDSAAYVSAWSQMSVRIIAYSCQM